MPGQNQWIEGPTTPDLPNEAWIPADSKIGGAWGTRWMMSPDKTDYLPGALQCTQALPTAHSRSYLVEPTLAAAQDRSRQQCKAFGCDGVHTVYWWRVLSLSDGTAAVVIQDSGPFSASTTVAGKTAGLTANEIAALKTAQQLGSLLPTVNR